MSDAIVNRIDWEACAAAFQQKGWTYYVAYSRAPQVPDANLLRETARRLLLDATSTRGPVASGRILIAFEDDAPRVWCEAVDGEEYFAAYRAAFGSYP